MIADIDEMDECPCGEDLTIDRETDVDELYEQRKAEHIKDHLKEEHTVSYYIGSVLAKITIAIERVLP